MKVYAFIRKKQQKETIQIVRLLFIFVCVTVRKILRLQVNLLSIPITGAVKSKDIKIVLHLFLKKRNLSWLKVFRMLYQRLLFNILKMQIVIGWL